MLVTGRGSTFDLPQAASEGWCLPGNGGPVVIRGYNTYRSRPHDLIDQRGKALRDWALDEALVPTNATTAAQCHGPAGRLSEGDCVVYVGLVEGGGDKPVVWAPQRVVAADDPNNGWQRVKSTLFLDPRQKYPDRNELGTEKDDPGPLRGPARRRVLELFDMNLDCEYCGGIGGPITYGLRRVPQGPLECPRPKQAGDPKYECLCCGARWTVYPNGDIDLQEPLPIL